MDWKWLKINFSRKIYYDGLQKLMADVEKNESKITTYNWYQVSKDNLDHSSQFKFLRYYVIDQLIFITGIKDGHYFNSLLKPYIHDLERWAYDLHEHNNVKHYLSLLNDEFVIHKYPFKSWLIKYFHHQHMNCSWILKETSIIKLNDDHHSTYSSNLCSKTEGSLNILPSPPCDYSYDIDFIHKFQRYYSVEMTLKRLEWRFLRIEKLPSHKRWLNKLTKEHCSKLNSHITLGDIIAHCNLPGKMQAEIGMVLYFRAKPHIMKCPQKEIKKEAKLFKKWAIIDNDIITLLANQVMVNGQFQRRDIITMIDSQMRNDKYIKDELHAF